MKLAEVSGRIRDGLAGIERGEASARDQAAVLVLLHHMNGVPEVVLTRRADHMRTHPGEIAFPGGRRDEEDRDAWHTALREAEEEIALPAHHVEPLGQLEFMVTRLDVEITPCIGLLTQPTDFVANPEELSSCFSAPLAWFAQPGSLVIEDIETEQGLKRVPHYRYGEHDIWGVTAFMLVRLANIGYNAGFTLAR